MTGAMINDKERFVCVWEEGGGGGGWQVMCIIYSNKEGWIK